MEDNIQLVEEKYELFEHFEQEVLPEMRNQIVRDHKKWGDTWKHRSRFGQEKRIFEKIQDYWDQFQYAGVPVPWYKIIGLCNIAIARENNLEGYWGEDRQ